MFQLNLVNNLLTLAINSVVVDIVDLPINSMSMNRQVGD